MQRGYLFVASMTISLFVIPRQAEGQWVRANAGLTNTNVRALAVSGTDLFAGTQGGVFRSTDNGTDWTQVNTDLTDIHVNALAVSGTTISAGTYDNGGGVWRRSLSGVTTSAGRPQTTEHSFTLEQNYPNPFNPATHDNPVRSSGEVTRDALSFQLHGPAGGDAR